MKSPPASSTSTAGLDRKERDLAGRYIGCSIEVEDIQATYSELVAKGVHFTGPSEK
jgi:hypothetical protein